MNRLKLVVGGLSMVTLGVLLTGAAKPEEKACCRGKAMAEAEDICPVLVGTTVPEVTLQTVAGKDIALQDHLAKKPTVLVFYRGGWCMYCNMQLGQLKKIEADILEMGYQIIAVSPDRPVKMRESIDKHDMNYTLLSDSTAEAAKAFGLAFRLADETLTKYKEYGIDLQAASGHDHHILPVPAVFILNKKGEIQFSYVNPQYNTRLEPDLLLAALKVYGQVK